LAQHRETIAARQHEVEHDRVVGIHEPQTEPVFAVHRRVDREPRLAQAALHETTDPELVFDYEYPHATRVAGAGVFCRATAARANRRYLPTMAEERRPGLIVARVLVGLGLLAATFWILRPFLVPGVWAAIAAYMTWPIYARARAWTGRPG